MIQIVAFFSIGGSAKRKFISKSQKVDSPKGITELMARSWCSIKLNEKRGAEVRGTKLVKHSNSLHPHNTMGFHPDAF